SISLHFKHRWWRIQAGLKKSLHAFHASIIIEAWNRSLACRTGTTKRIHRLATGKSRPCMRMPRMVVFFAASTRGKARTTDEQETERRRYHAVRGHAGRDGDGAAIAHHAVAPFGASGGHICGRDGERTGHSIVHAFASS